MNLISLSLGSPFVVISNINIEDPPKWDVVLTNDFHPKRRVFNINDVCDVTYGNGTSPAEILKYGRHRSVPK